MSIQPGMTVIGVPWFLIIVILVVIVVVAMASSSRRKLPEGQQRCEKCGAEHPHFAQFCRRCGKKF